MRRYVVFLTVGMMSACGLDTSPSDAPAEPIERTLESDRYLELNAGERFRREFDVPVDAYVKYSLQDRSTTSPDKWNVGIAAEAEWQYFDAGQPWRAYAPNNDVSTISDGADVPAGRYALAIQCINWIERCMLSFDLSVTY